MADIRTVDGSTTKAPTAQVAKVKLRRFLQFSLQIVSSHFIFLYSKGEKIPDVPKSTEAYGNGQVSVHVDLQLHPPAYTSTVDLREGASESPPPMYE